MNFQRQDPSRFIFLSLALHLIFFSTVLLSQLVFHTTPILSLPTIQVDVVALPDQMKNAKAEPIDLSKPIKENARQEHKAQKAKPDEMVFHPQKNKNQVEKEAQLALERLQKEVKNAENKKRQQDLKNFEDKYRAALKGNTLNKGTSMTGELKVTADAYGASIRNRIVPHWGLPAWLSNQNLRAVVRIFIGPNGQLLSYKFMQSSGNQVFDDYVREAITQATPFAPPPANMAGALRSGGIDVLFPL